MNEYEQSDLEKETNDFHSSCYQNAILYKEKENTFIKNCKCGLFSLVCVIKPGRSMTKIFSVRLQKTEKAMKANLNI